MNYDSRSERRDAGTRAWVSRDAAATEAIGQALAARLDPGAVVLLEGDLGAGKTVFVRGLAHGLGLDPDAVQSPTFTIVHEHGALDPSERSPRLIHVDLYRLDPEEADAMGIDELLAGPGVKAIEWPERLPAVPPLCTRIQIRAQEDGVRRIVVEGVDLSPEFSASSIAGPSVDKPAS